MMDQCKASRFACSTGEECYGARATSVEVAGIVATVLVLVMLLGGGATAGGCLERVGPSIDSQGNACVHSRVFRVTLNFFWREGA